MKTLSISASTSVMFPLMEMHELHSELINGGKSEFCLVIVKYNNSAIACFSKKLQANMHPFISRVAILIHGIIVLVT